MSKSINEEEHIERSADDHELEKARTRTDESQTEEETPLKTKVMDPLKDIKRLKFLKGVISNLCLLVLFLAVKNMFVGICAYLFYDNKGHLVIFGSLCALQAVGAPIGFFAIKFKNNVLFLVCVVINCAWIIAVTVLLLYYWLAKKSEQFNNEIELHVSAIFYMIMSILLAICCFLVLLVQRNARQ